MPITSRTQPKHIVNAAGHTTTVHALPDNTPSAASAARLAHAPSVPPTTGSIRVPLVLDINENAPFPQANDLSKVAATLELIQAGASTPDALSIGVESNAKSPRAGNYYGDAAVYLGLAEKVSENDIAEFALTHKGLMFASLSLEERTAVLAESVDQIPAVGVYREQGEDALRDFIETEYGYSDATLERRVACIASWSNQAEATDFQQVLASSSEMMANVAPEAIERANAQRAEAREKIRMAEPKQGEVCSECFMVKPLSGICTNCA